MPPTIEETVLETTATVPLTPLTTPSKTLLSALPIEPTSPLTPFPSATKGAAMALPKAPN